MLREMWNIELGMMSPTLNSIQDEDGNHPVEDHRGKGKHIDPCENYPVAPSDVDDYAHELVG